MEVSVAIRIGCRPSGTFAVARITRARGESEPVQRRLRARDFEVSGKPERLRSWLQGKLRLGH
jgi:hypothetical protein